MKSCALISFLSLCVLMFGLAPLASAQTPPPYNYTDRGPSLWNSLYPNQCATGSRQSPFNIVTSSVTRANLPRIVFHYTHPITFLDHDDQLTIDHGDGNFITIGKTVYKLIQLHEHTPSEYTVNGVRYPLEFHFVHVSAAGQYAVVGVFAKSGRVDKGIVQPPSFEEPDAVIINPRSLLPKNKSYWRFNGSLTTPGSTSPFCGEGILWTEMRNPITMSADQIQAFEDSALATWGTTNTARTLQPSNNRFILLATPRAHVDP